MANTADYTYWTRPRLLAMMGEAISTQFNEIEGESVQQTPVVTTPRFLERMTPINAVGTPPVGTTPVGTPPVETTPEDSSSSDYPRTPPQVATRVPPCSRMLFATPKLFELWCETGDATLSRPTSLLKEFPNIFVVPLFTANVWPALVKALIDANRKMVYEDSPDGVAYEIRKFWKLMASGTL